jgi:hypothetical protein
MEQIHSLFRPPLFAVVGASDRLLLEREVRSLETVAVMAVLGGKIAAEAALAVTLALAETVTVEPAEEVRELLVLVAVAVAATEPVLCTMLVPVAASAVWGHGLALAAALDYTGRVQMAQGELGSCPDHISPKWAAEAAAREVQPLQQHLQRVTVAAFAITFVAAFPVFSVAAVLAPLLVV